MSPSCSQLIHCRLPAALPLPVAETSNSRAEAWRIPRTFRPDRRISPCFAAECLLHTTRHAFREVTVRPGDPVRIRGEQWRVTRRVPYDDVALIEVAGADATNRGTRAAFLLPFEPIERLALSETPRVVRPTEWRRVARAALAEATPSPCALRAAARARLRHHSVSARAGAGRDRDAWLPPAHRRRRRPGEDRAGRTDPRRGVRARA